MFWWLEGLGFAMFRQESLRAAEASPVVSTKVFFFHHLLAEFR